MSERHLGAPFDLHGGGQDLVFPHHENELAQSAAYSGLYPFARTWMHVGLVTMDGTKMSKSLGNMAFARELLTRYHPDALRLYLLRTHYRAPLDYDEQALAQAEGLAERLRRAAQGGNHVPSRPDPGADAGRAEALAALDDDLDTPRALAALERLAAAALGARARDDPNPALSRAVRDLSELLGLTLSG
jgi:cysteinyl-tRNA synthetase